MNKSRLFCDGWEFSKNPIDTSCEEAADWHPVDIPHDWMIYQTRDLYETSTGWYRKTFTSQAAEGRRTAVRFEGVYMDSRVYVNGTLAGEWKYGYSTFEFDITSLIHKGENEIAVRVDYRSPNTRWYSGAGIFRDVYIKEYEPVHIAPDGIYISTSGDEVQVTVECERPCDTAVDDLSLTVRIAGDGILAERTVPVCACDISSVPVPIRHEGMKFSSNTVSFVLDGVKKWDIDDPVLYTAEVILSSGGTPVHEENVRFGFRDMRFDTDKGFFLNGRHVKIHGCCEHHDNGALGAAFNRSAFRRKLEKLRAIGVNAIRTSHNMPAVGVLELADEMGFLVLDEAFDMWEFHKTEYDYAGYFTEWVEKDVASWIRRDRNHPCIIGWSLGNEIYDTHAGEHGQEIASRLVSLVRMHDPRCNGFVTIGSNYMQWPNAQKCADIVKLAGYNYTERLYEEHHKAHPDWFIYGSETASTLQSRGIYHFPLEQTVLTDDDKQCSAIGNCYTGWGSRNTEANIIADRDAQFCAGQFIWTGFDYIGEPTPYDTKNSYFGQFDTAGFPKDSAYIYRAEWTDYRKSPFVHIFPHWDFSEGDIIDVRVTTNAPKVKLFFRADSDKENALPIDSAIFLIAEKDIDHIHGKELTLDCKLVYMKGEVTAVAYDEDGSEVARDTVRSFGDAEKIMLEPESDTLKADGRDLIYVDISAADKDGVFAANANDRIFVEVTGAGRLIGLDNGDSTDYEQYKGTSRRLFSGRLVAIIAATDRTGEIKLRATSPSLAAAEITLTALPAEYPEGITSFEENTHTAAHCPAEETDIPVRRVDFRTDMGRSFRKGMEELVVEPVIYPANASERYINEIKYRITTPLGIESNLAMITEEDGKIRIHCAGDGEFCLRALVYNGTEQCHIISAVTFDAQGIGSAAFDPYKFIHGGLHDIGSENVVSGIEKGVSFAHEDSWFGFENVDFGPLGSDIITIPIYSNSNDPVKLEIYDSTPDGGELLGSFIYDLAPQWMTYQPVTYRLNKKLTGMHTIVMRSADGYSVKGFEFGRTRREFSEIRATDNTNIYGDKFTVGEDAVTGIGNNVVLDFGEFDFTEKQPEKLYITGRTPLPVNSVHLIAGGDENRRILCEFTHSDEYTEQCFDIDLSGKCSISFGFLPGSDFDFRSFRFE